MQEDRIHLKAPKGWMNDPNGFIYYKGNYHLFYQYFPYATRWATMRWGHAVSRDLVHWEHQDVALFPTKYEDQNGCFSGSAVEKDGDMYLFYTGVHYDKPDPEDVHICLDDAFTSAQIRITSGDGFRFDNFGGKKVAVPVIRDPKIGDSANARDPKVWRGSDAWYLMIGSTTQERRGELVFYKSKDLLGWEFVNTASFAEIPGWMWECPDYFSVNGEEVLVVSSMRLLEEGPLERNQTICMPVAFEENTCTMRFLDTYQYLDYGLDLYAPQSTLDAQGRRIMVAWLRMPQAVDGRWIGMFCMPRVVEVKDGHIYFRVHPDIERLYTRPITCPKEADPAGYRVSTDLADGEWLSIGGYRIRRQNDRICTDRSAVFPENTNFCMQSMTPELKGGCHLDVYVDPHLIEIFVNGGEYVISHAVYNLGDEITTDLQKEIRIDTIEEK